MSRRTVKSVKACCDRLWAQLIKVRADGRCERCQRPDRLEAHHAYGRTDHRLRFVLENGVALCHACHRWAEQFPFEFTDWFREQRTEDAVVCAAERREGILKRTLHDYLALEAALKEQLA